MRLSGVLGQKRALEQLSAELQAGRLAHAYLFVGPTGCGRGTTARALFMAANCRRQEGETPCGRCGPCHRLLAGTHEDFVVLAPPSDALSAQIKVEAVREVIRTLGYAPFGGGLRMVLFRGAEHLNPYSANALLKVLEEPPPGNILVLSVQDTRDILPTLVSRCRRVNFSPLNDQLICRELVRRGVPEPEARLKAALSGGSLGRALELDEKELARELARLLEQLQSREGPAGDWRFAEELMRRFRGPQRIDRQGLARVLDLLALYFRDAAVAAAGRPQAALLPPDGAPAPGWDLDGALESFTQVRRAQERIMMNASPELVLSVLFGRLRRGRGATNAFSQ